MRATAEEFYARHHLADLSVTSTMGLNASDQALIRKQMDSKRWILAIFVMFCCPIRKLPCVFSRKRTTFRLMSSLQENAPKSNEIALDFLYQDKYKLGDTIRVTEEKMRDHIF